MIAGDQGGAGDDSGGEGCIGEEHPEEDDPAAPEDSGRH